MRPLYTASMILGNKSRRLALEDIVFKARNWAKKKFGDRAVHNFFEGCDWKDKDRSVETRLVTSDGQRYFALKLEHPDNKDSALIWRTTFAVNELEKGAAKDKMHMASVIVSNGMVTGDMLPVHYSVFRPFLVKDLVLSFPAYAGKYPLNHNSVIADTAKNLAMAVSDSDRALPLLVVTRRFDSGEYPFDPEKLSDLLVGLAHVIRVDDNRRGPYSFNKSFERWSGGERGCYNGAVKLYWPKRDTDARNLFWFFEEANRTDFVHGIVDDLTKISIHRNVPISYEKVVEVVNREKVAMMQQNISAVLSNAELSEADHAEMIKEFEGVIQLYESDKAALNLRVAELERSVLEVESDKMDLEQTVRELKAKNLALEHSIDQLKADAAPVVAPPPPYDPEEHVFSVSDAVEEVLKQYPGSPLIILESAKQMAGKFDFRDPVMVYRAFEWLATKYVDLRIEGNGKPLDVIAMDETGMHYKSKQSETTMGRNPRDYYVKWNGENRGLEEHLAKGNSKGNMIRIGFFYDSDSRQVVVGYIGYHQKNRKG